jgi:hypothetical protein
MPSAPTTVRPEQVAVIDNVPPVVSERDCQNWALAAGLEIALRLQGVAQLKQTSWVRQLGDEKDCPTTLGDITAFTSAIDREYTEDDGTRVQVHAVYRRGADITPDDLIGPILEHIPALLIWKGQLFVLYGVEYNRHVDPSGRTRSFQVLALKLIDPRYPTTSSERFTSLVAGKNDFAEVDGLLHVSVGLLKSAQ